MRAKVAGYIVEILELLYVCLVKRCEEDQKFVIRSYKGMTDLATYVLSLNKLQRNLYHEKVRVLFTNKYAST